MGRPTKDRSGAATETLTLRLTPEDRGLLDRLVALRAEELADEVTAASYVRDFIRHEAQRKGLAPVKKPGSRRKSGPEREPTADDVRAALGRAVDAGESQRSIARRAGLDASRISRFAKGEAGLAPESLRKLAAALETK